MFKTFCLPKVVCLILLFTFFLREYQFLTLASTVWFSCAQLGSNPGLSLTPRSQQDFLLNIKITKKCLLNLEPLLKNDLVHEDESYIQMSLNRKKNHLYKFRKIVSLNWKKTFNQILNLFLIPRCQ